MIEAVIKSTALGQGIIPRTQRRYKSIAHTVPYYCVIGEDILSEYNCIKYSVVEVN